MKTITKELLGFNVPVVGVCETIAELVTAAGSEEVVVNDNNNQVLAHSHFGVLRNVIVTQLEKATGVPRKTVKNKLVEKDGEEETQGKYRARLDEELGEETVQAIQAQIAEACEKIPVDYTPGVRGSGESAMPAKKWLELYDQAVTENKVDYYVAKLGVDATLTGDELRIAFANAAKARVTAAMQAAAKNALA
jgi:hypothetical protein